MTPDAVGDMAAKPATIDSYLATVDREKRAALQALRSTIHALVPGLVECVSYGMPAFRHDGRVIAGFQATKAGCSYYPFSGTTLSTVAGALGAYSKTKSALHFTPASPLPRAMIRKLLKARIAEIKATGR
jgi:uncharacterized protein YdhG (YjbR/CyaY superfamily)